jgi:hypothetical protein
MLTQRQQQPQQAWKSAKHQCTQWRRWQHKRHEYEQRSRLAAASLQQQLRGWGSKRCRGWQ